MASANQFTRRGALRSLAAWPAASAWGQGTKRETTSRKKGVCALSTAHLGDLKAKWWYNWSAYGKNEGGCEFVPMVKGTPHFKPALWAHIKSLKEKGFKELLGYNEPERDSQGNLTVEEALTHWPKLQDTGLRLGSPAPSSDDKGMTWLEAFMKAADKARLRIDFLALHWYRSGDVGKFEGWLKEMNRKFRRPIWLTEFNGGALSDREHEKFLKAALRVLERHDFVERYAYFSPGPGRPGSLFQKSDPPTLTDLGAHYQET